MSIILKEAMSDVLYIFCIVPALPFAMGLRVVMVGAPKLAMSKAER